MQSLSTADINILISLATKPTEMTTAEFYRGYYLCRVLFRRMENDYFQFKAGTFEAATWEAYVRGFREDTFNNPAVRVMWKLQSDYLDPAFGKYMQLQIDEASRVAQQNVRAQFEQLIAGEHRQNDVAPDAA